MALPSRRRIKKELSRKLIYSPMLRILLFNIWFRIAFVSIVGFGIFLGLYLPKMWRTSPNGFNPVIRVSGLDLTQSWALKRSARKADANHQVKQAYFSWLAAVGQNPSDKSALRGFLNNFTLVKSPNQRQVEAALGQSIWLLRIGKTNAVDVELVTRLCDTFHWNDICLYFFDPIADQLKGEVEVRYLKALFYQGRMSEFARRLADYKKANGSMTELQWYDVAYKAGWGNGSESVEAMRQLQAEHGRKENEILATRLLMMAAGERRNIPSYKECLDTLAGQNEASTLDYIQYWRLLAISGRKSEAISMAERFASSPVSAYEMLQLAEVYSSLGLIEQSHDVLRKFAPSYARSPEVWSAYASVLDELQDWQEMRGVALQIREHRGNDTLWGYSYFLEGRAELAQARITTAEIAFRKASEANYPLPALGFIVAKKMTELKYPTYARPIFKKIESTMSDREEFWEAMFDCAYQLKDAEGVLKAAEHDYKLNPLEVVKVNRYAAALLVNRAQPELAVELTMRLVNSHPKSAPALINHSLALLLNNRTEDARKTLSRVNLAKLTPIEKSAYKFALFDLAVRFKDFQRAWNDSDEINRQTLFRPQIEWLETSLKKLPPRVTASY